MHPWGWMFSAMSLVRVGSISFGVCPLSRLCSFGDAPSDELSCWGTRQPCWGGVGLAWVRGWRDRGLRLEFSLRGLRFQGYGWMVRLKLAYEYPSVSVHGNTMRVLGAHSFLVLDCALIEIVSKPRRLRLEVQPVMLS